MGMLSERTQNQNILEKNGFIPLYAFWHTGIFLNDKLYATVEVTKDGIVDITITDADIDNPGDEDILAQFHTQLRSKWADQEGFFEELDAYVTTMLEDWTDKEGKK